MSLLWVTSLGRVSKIHDIFPHEFIGFLTSIKGMVKWVTPLGRVFKIHDIFRNGFNDVLIL